MKEIYRKYESSEPEELYKILTAQEKINEIIEEKPILKEVLVGYGTLFNLSPLDILEKMDYKSDIEIRTEFEGLKKKNNIRGGKNIFTPEQGNPFDSNV